MVTQLQPQRVPLGEFSLGGERVQVFISTPWYRQLEQLAATVAAQERGDGSEQDDTAPLPLLHFDVQPDDTAPMQFQAPADESDQGPDGHLAGHLSGLEQRLSAHGADPLVHQLQAQIAALEARIQGLEQGAMA